MILLMILPLSALGLYDEEAAPEDIVLDTSMYGVITKKVFKKSAMLALVQRGWEIVSVAPERLVGKLGSYEVEIVLKGQNIHIAFLPDSLTERLNYLDNLKRDLQIEVVRLID